MLAGLMSRWIRPAAWASISEPQTCLQNVDDRCSGCGPNRSTSGLQRHAIEQFHGIVKNPFGRAAIIVNRDRIGMVQLAGQLHLALEAGDRDVGRFIRIDQFDGRGPAEHGVMRPIDRPHAARSDPLFQDVLSEAFGFQRRAASRALQPGHQDRIDEDDDRRHEQCANRPQNVPPHRRKRRQRLRQIHFGDDAEIHFRKPVPSSDRGDAAIVAIADYVRATFAFGHLGGGICQRLFAPAHFGRSPAVMSTPGLRTWTLKIEFASSRSGSRPSCFSSSSKRLSDNNTPWASQA